MGPVIGELLPLAVGVALSPIPIVAAILMILSPDAGVAGSGFAAGWVAGILGATVVFTLLAGTLGDTGDEPSAAVSWVKVALGALLIALAAAQWRARSDTAAPGWMRAVDRLTPVRAAGLGVVLSAANPKNLLLCVSAGVAIGSGGLGGGGVVLAVAVFAVLSASSVLAVAIGYAVAADRLRPALDRARTWLQDNNHAVLAIVLLVMGSVVLGSGIGGL